MHSFQPHSIHKLSAPANLRAFLAIAAATLGTTELSHAQNQFRWLDSCQTSGTCTSNVLLPTSGISSRKMLPADLDLDGDVDILSAGPSLNFVRNEMVLGAAPGYGVYTAASNQIGVAFFDVTDGVLADFDNDGDLDFAFCTNPQFGSGSVRVMMNTTITTGPATPLLADGPVVGWTVPGTFGAFSSIATGDFNGDGDIDLIVGSTTGLQLLDNVPGAGTTRTFVNISAGRVAAFAGLISDVAAADLDGDGDVDLALAGGTLAAPTRTVAQNPGPAGQFGAAPLPASVLSIPTTVEAADLDANGSIDLAYGHLAIGTGPGTWGGGQLVLFSNNGAGAFAISQTTAGPQSITDIVVGEIDENGMVDIMASCREEAASFFISGAWVTFFLPGRTLLYSRPSAGLNFVDVTVGRVDDDSVALSGLPSEGESIALADVDLDLDLDAIVGHRFFNALGLLENLLWQLEAPRVVTYTALPTTPVTYVWNVPYDLYCEFGIPGAGGVALSAVAVSLTPPVHVFPPGPFGIATSAPFVTGPTTVVSSGQGNFTMQLGPFSASQLATFMGTSLYAQGGIWNLTTNAIRLTGVVHTVVQ